MYNISFSNPAIAYSVCLRTYGGGGSGCGGKGGIVIIIINLRARVKSPSSSRPTTMVGERRILTTYLCTASYTHNMHNIEIINKGVDVLSPEDVPRGRDTRQRLGSRVGLPCDVVAGGLAVHVRIYIHARL